MSFIDKVNLKSFDFYTKVDENYRVQTAGGGYLSIIGWILISIMLVGQTYTWLTPRFHEHMIVNTSLGEKLTINLDISFHALTCAEAHLDAMDVAGDNQLNMEDSMFKQRLTSTGDTIVDKTAQRASDLRDPNECLPCYGAESGAIKCCNTCQELKDAYAALGWSTAEVVKSAKQCVGEVKVNPYVGIEKGEGCRIYGQMTVNRVAGNIHIAHGESIVRDGRHIHQFNAAEAPSFNTSHTINSLSFGKKYPGMPPGPLNGNVRIVDAKVGTGLFQYFIKVIPTTYTNQYTMTERFRPLVLPTFPRLPDGTPDFRKAQQSVLPGIFFVYDVSPFLVEVVRSRVPLLHYLTRVCSTIGGVIAVMGVIDRAWYSFQKWRTAKSS
eukprot:GSChrysophyteH1.ASY1.ANO1.994.1 assembled CDS